MSGYPTPSPEQFDLLTAQLSARDAALAERESEVAQLRKTIATLEHTLTVRTLEIEVIKLQLSVLRRMQFGRKSEKFERQIDALETRLEDLLAEEREAEIAAPVAKPPRNKAVRRPFPEHLERDVKIHGFRRINGLQRADHISCGAPIQEEPRCLTSKGCAFRPT